MDRLETLLDMIEHPELYTEQQVKAMLDDEDMRKHYDTMVALRMAFAEMEDGRWKIENEEPSIPASIFHLPSSFRKMAAALLAFVLMGGLAIAALYFHKAQQSHVAQSPHDAPVAIDTMRPSTEKDSAIRFENIRFDSLIHIVSKSYHYALAFQSDDPRHLRVSTTWQPNEPLPTFIERMNELDGLRLTIRQDTIIVTKP